MLEAILYFFGSCTLIFLVALKISSKPYPKELENKENIEFENKMSKLKF